MTSSLTTQLPLNRRGSVVNADTHVVSQVIQRELAILRPRRNDDSTARAPSWPSRQLDERAPDTTSAAGRSWQIATSAPNFCACTKRAPARASRNPVGNPGSSSSGARSRLPAGAHGFNHEAHRGLRRRIHRRRRPKAPPDDDHIGGLARIKLWIHARQAPLPRSSDSSTRSHRDTRRSRSQLRRLKRANTPAHPRPCRYPSTRTDYVYESKTAQPQRAR